VIGMAQSSADSSAEDWRRAGPRSRRPPGYLFLGTAGCPFAPASGKDDARVRSSASCSFPGSARRLRVTAWPAQPGC